MAISVLRLVPLKEAEDARYTAVDALTARVEAEEKAERARLAAEEALQAQRAAEEALEQARLAAEEAEGERIADERTAERARRAAEETLHAWRKTITAEDRRPITAEDRRPPERVEELPPPFPEEALRAAGLGQVSTPEVEPHEPEPPVEEEPEPPAPEEQPVAVEEDLIPEPPPTPAEEEPVAVATELSCTIAFWRGYRKGAFYARALDEEGYEVALAESPQFKARGKEGPEQTDDAVAAYRVLVAQLEHAGWEADDCDETWFGQTFRRPL